MGFDDKGTQFLMAARRLGVSFERTATIGRQRLYLTPPLLRRRLGTFGIETTVVDTRRLFDEGRVRGAAPPSSSGPGRSCRSTRRPTRVRHGSWT